MDNKYISVYKDRKLQNLAKKLNFIIYKNEQWNGWGYEVTDRYLSLNKKELKKWQQEVKKLKNKQELEIKKLEARAKNRKWVIKALYSINKEAKRQRDTQRNLANTIWTYGYNMPVLHTKLHDAKYKKIYLYDLKSAVIEKLYKAGEFDVLGYHTFPGGLQMIYLVSKSMPEFTFHALSEDLKIDLDNLPNLGELPTIDATRTKKTTPPKKAEIILKAYLKLED